MKNSKDSYVGQVQRLSLRLKYVIINFDSGLSIYRKKGTETTECLIFLKSVLLRILLTLSPKFPQILPCARKTSG